MIALQHTSDAPSILRFPTLVERQQGLDPNAKLTLRAYYDTVLLPEIREAQSPNSLRSDRTALNHWERLTGDPDLREVTREHLILLRDGLVCSDSTKDKTWRELKAMFEAAAEDQLIARVPAIARRMKCRIVSHAVKRPQREIITEAELTRLWRACAHATYPAGGEHPAPQLWRVALVLFWTYGARTLDFFQHLRWEHLRWGDGLLSFTAAKTRKLQGLPLTSTVEQHLRSIKGHSERVFPGFETPGSRLHGGVKRGYYATWNHEIVAQAELAVPVQLKHFRQRVVTYYNGIEPGLGGWIAGHYMPGVTAQHYDLPTQRIRQAICSAPVPACFRELD